MAKVSLRVAHQRKCGEPEGTNAGKTSLESLETCNCKPSYYTFYRDRSGKPVKGPRLRDRRVADRAMTARQAELDAGRVLRVERNITFAAWSDTWLSRHQAKKSTLDLYRHTVSVAKRAFGDLTLREIEASDVQRFLDLLRSDGEERRERAPTDTTLAKHLGHLHSCFAAAIPEYVAANPVALVHKSLRPRRESERWDYFTNHELTRLWASFDRREDLLGLYLCKAAITTGLRLGELVALTRSDIDLRGRSLTVSRAYRTEGGVTKPKTGKARTVQLSEDATGVLREWFELRSANLFQPVALLFPNSAGNHLDRAKATKLMLYPAMKEAKPPKAKRLRKGEWGIPRLGERGNLRSFHSFRHTYARLVLEAGGDRFWLQQQLGHSTAAMTERYSMWSKQAEQAQAASFAAGAFHV